MRSLERMLLVILSTISENSTLVCLGMESSDRYDTFEASVTRMLRLTGSIVHCDRYLCPGTLACVHFPHHCPCAFPDVEDKVELGDGIAVCASKGGYAAGEMQRKVELARKGLI